MKPIEHINSEDINFYIEKNLYDFYFKSSQHINFISHVENSIRWVLPRSADWPYCIYLANFQLENIEEKIKEIKTLIRKGKAPNGWTIGPLTKPDDLGKYLEQLGFKNVYKQAGMAIHLDSLVDKSVANTEIQIKKVEDISSLKLWSDSVSTVFGIKTDFPLLKFLLGEKESVFYNGFHNDNVVSSLMLYISSGVAGLHAVSTLPDYRNMGFGLAISKYALLDAYDMGYRVGVLQASSMGERVYRKLGFHKFCDIISYELELE